MNAAAGDLITACAARAASSSEQQASKVWMVDGELPRIGVEWVG